VSTDSIERERGRERERELTVNVDVKKPLDKSDCVASAKKKVTT